MSAQNQQGLAWNLKSIPWPLATHLTTQPSLWPLKLDVFQMRYTSEDRHLPISCLYSVAPQWGMFLYSKIIRPFLPIYVVSWFLPSEVIHTWPYWACGVGKTMILLWWPFVVSSSCRKNLSLLLICFPKCFNSVSIDFKVNPRTVTSTGPCTSAANQIPPNHKWKMRSV